MKLMYNVNLLKVGGWMKFRKYFTFTSKKKRGFTIIESLVYIFLTTMILVEGINLFVLMYKSYMDTLYLSIKYNNYQNFYINLDYIISEGGLDTVTVNDNTILLTKTINDPVIYKKIRSYNGKIVVKCLNKRGDNPIDTMLQDIDTLDIYRKGKVIYFIIHDKDGKEFIRCI